MMVLITYDVDTTSASGSKRLRQVAKACKDYGQRVQNSVFECVLTQAQLIVLKNRLENIIDLDLDNIRFYYLGNNWQRHVEFLGKDSAFDVTGELII